MELYWSLAQGDSGFHKSWDARNTIRYKHYREREQNETVYRSPRPIIHRARVCNHRGRVSRRSPRIKRQLLPGPFLSKTCTCYEPINFTWACPPIPGLTAMPLNLMSSQVPTFSVRTVAARETAPERTRASSPLNGSQHVLWLQWKNALESEQNKREDPQYYAP